MSAGRRSFDDDVWELYHVAADPSECEDLAAAMPDKIRVFGEVPAEFNGLARRCVGPVTACLQ